ncbi:MAG TPA: hypothetical protein VMF89_18305, partial [Polyangiales bacterium]|nr:hypothetical protein [Polyangiales bacterium]
VDVRHADDVWSDATRVSRREHWNIGGVLKDRAEARSKRFERDFIEILVLEDQDVMVALRLLELKDQLGRQLLVRVQPVDLGAQRRTIWSNFDRAIPVTHRSLLVSRRT